MRPWRSTASMAYAEQLGKNRQAGGRAGASQRRYPRMAAAAAREGLFMSLSVCLTSRQGNRQPLQELRQASAHLTARVATDVAAGEKQEVRRLGAFALARQDLPGDAPDAAARDRASAGAAQGKDQPAPARGVVRTDGPWSCADPDALSPQVTGQSLPAPPTHRRPLNGQAVPTLGTPPLENLSPVRRAHPLEKAVASLALALVRLICPLHAPSS